MDNITDFRLHKYENGLKSVTNKVIFENMKATTRERYNAKPHFGVLWVRTWPSESKGEFSTVILCEVGLLNQNYNILITIYENVTWWRLHYRVTCIHSQMSYTMKLPKDLIQSRSWIDQKINRKLSIFFIEFLFML
jgi:hypothetical protein